MTRVEQLVFCRKCLNRKRDLKQGFICKLTGEKATFQDECSDFVLDETVKERSLELDDKEVLKLSEIQQRLPFETVEKLRMEQSLMSGITSGLIVGFVGSILWSILTVVIGVQLRYVALAIGAGVGLTIRKVGNGIDPVFGYWGGGIALFSILLGNFLSIIGFIANSTGLGYIETLFLFDYGYLFEVMKTAFNIMDLSFYGIAVFAGYKFSFRKITQKRIMALKQGNVSL